MSNEHITPIITQKITTNSAPVLDQSVPIYKRAFYKLPSRNLFFNRNQPIVTNLSTTSTAPIPTIPSPNYVVNQYESRSIPFLNSAAEENLFERGYKTGGCQGCFNSIPWWCWLAGLLLLLPLLGTLLYFMITSPVINPANRIIKYIYGTNYRSYVFNRTEIYYVPQPCLPNNLLNLSNETSSYPLCNQTSSNISVYQYERDTSNVVTPVGSGVNFKSLKFLTALGILIATYIFR